MTDRITITLTPVQAKVLFNTIDGAADAGSCADGCTPQELEALADISQKLLQKRANWITTKLKAMP